ncbi:MAG: phosphoribosylglycinamide formyltransferase [Nitrospiria bacterium]
MDEKLRIGVLVSGVGSNLSAIIDAIDQKVIQVEIRIVISNKKGAQALERAKKRGLKSIYLDPSQYPNSAEYEIEIVRLFRESKVEWIVLAGYLKIVSAELLSAFSNRILNIHPSLLPAFTGLHAQQQALDYGVKVTGCTVHLVDSGIDTGPIIAQAAVPVFDNDTVETLSERILKKEHQIYPMILKWISEKRLRIEGRKVLLDPAVPLKNSEMISPGDSQ